MAQMVNPVGEHGTRPSRCKGGEITLFPSTDNGAHETITPPLLFTARALLSVPGDLTFDQNLLEPINEI